MAQTPQEARQDGYVECDWCGHLCEGHDTDGCGQDDCGCPVKLTKKEIAQIRKDYGLPARFDRSVLQP